MKILIATKNKAKFDIISKMIYSILGKDIDIRNLNGYDDFVEVPEKGNNIKRARDKAINAKKQIKDKFDYILGIDDGIIINNQEYAAVKEHLYDLVVGDKVKIGSKIYITRAYYLITLDGKEKSCYNKIPYIIQKKLDSFEKMGYPLNSVISTIDNDMVLSSRKVDELNEYFLKYSIEDLKKLFDK